MEFKEYNPLWLSEEESFPFYSISVWICLILSRNSSLEVMSKFSRASLGRLERPVRRSNREWVCWIAERDQ